MRRLGDYELIEELGRGGMGVVFKARQTSMDRIVAVKVLPSFAGMDAAAVARFRREAEIAGRLAHPGIVPVHAVGESDGVHFYAMELVDGDTLTALLDRIRSAMPGRLRLALVEECKLADRYPALREPPGRSGVANRYVRSCVALIIEICDALAAAHEQRIVHRDLKPGNVMVRDQGRVALLDFGLARDELAAGLTRSGDQMGTPLYMAPEQVRGEKDIDARADIWAVGALLYELLALRTPFTATHDAEVLRSIAEDEPTRLRKWNPQVPATLEAIVRKCLEKDRDARYPVIEALELELRAFLAGQSVATRTPGVLGRIVGAFRRNRRIAVLVGIVLAFAVFTAGVVSIASLRIDAHRGREALAQAREVLIEQGDIERVKALYARAETLLGERDEVTTARVGDAATAFDRYYSTDRAVVERLFASLSADELAQLGDLPARVAGRGRLVARGPDRDDVALEVRRFAGGRLEPDWRPLAAGGELAIGEYLVRLTGPSRSIVRHAVIERDSATALLGPSSIATSPPDGMVPVFETGADRGSWIATTEMSVGELAAALEAQPERQAYLELPDARTAGDPDLPVRGVSFRQARSIAAFVGAHLPSRAEYLLAASGGLSGLVFPWGVEFDSRRLVADPDNLDAPQAAAKRVGGASPLGVQHLLGNVAEYLSPGRNGEIVLAGGHYQTLEPTALRLGSAELFEPIGSVDEARRYAGLRLARFLPPPDDIGASRAAAARLEELIRTSTSSLAHAWSLSADGDLSYELAVVRHAGSAADHTVTLPLVTDGFVQRSIRVADGHGSRMESTHETDPIGEASRVTVEWPGVRKGQRLRFRVACELVPASGLVRVGDAYELRLPSTAVSVIPIVHHLTLPRGCRVDSIEGADFAELQTFHLNGEPHLVWEFPVSAHRSVQPLVVRFRRDGLLAPEEPRWSRTIDFVEELFGAMQSGDRAKLSELLDSRFTEQPGNMSRDRRLSAHASAQQYEGLVFDDVTVVGSTVTVDVTADWRIGGQNLVVKDWPIRLQLVRDGHHLRVLRLAPRTRADTGTVTADGGYEHERLRLRIEPIDESGVIRTQSELTEMQVRFAGAGVRLEVLGLFDRLDRGRDIVRALMTVGSLSAEMAREVAEDRVESVVDLAGASCEEWVFQETVDRWTREQRTFVTRGRRHFLIRAIAVGPSETETTRRFRAARPWFERVAGRVQIR